MPAVAVVRLVVFAIAILVPACLAFWVVPLRT
jgi:hypothetical protein